MVYFLLKNPVAYQAAQAEVDKVIGRRRITVDKMSQLPYITACLRETLPLCPTVPALSFQISPNFTEQTTLIGGKYALKKG